MSRVPVIALVLLLAACASHPALREAEVLARQGEHESAWRLLRDAAAASPQDEALRSARQREAELGLLSLAAQAENARAAGQLEAAADLLLRMEAIDPLAPRTRALQLALGRARRHEALLTQAEHQLQAGQRDAAREAVAQVLAEDPGQPRAQALQQKLRRAFAPPLAAPTLAAAYQKPVSLEFRDAPLRTVFEALSRGAGVNFVFDKDVKADARVSVYLKDVSVDEAMRIVLSTQQLERKLLNDNSVLIYPNTQQKQREHQELVTRSFYLNNADVKQAQALVRMMAKTRDVFIDERLNLLVARDTPEVIAMIEQLVAGLDLPEPEVMLDVEVLELGTDRSAEAGLNWATDATYGSTDTATMVPWSSRGSFRTLVANPVVAARLKGESGANNLLANPKLRARNKEKAKIQIGDRVPVFTSTSTANVGVSTAVTYIDVGIKLEVEPTVQLDNDVVMKVNLEVSSLGVKETSGGPQPTSAYRIGTRNASTSLRLRDGETQVLGGLINDEDRKTIAGVPYVSETPLLGRLFGVHTDSRKKTEIVLLITPHVLRNLSLPDAGQTVLASGFDANPGAEGLRLRASRGNAAAPSLSDTTPAGARPLSAAIAKAQAARSQGQQQALAPVQAPAQPEEATVELQLVDSIAAGENLTVTLANRSRATVAGRMTYDAALFTRADVDDAQAGSGLAEVELAPEAQQVVVLRARPDAAGRSGSLQFVNAKATGPNGEALKVRVEGGSHVEVR
ncbi:secretin N-terminal domain-containing protein [Roseateles saccharophilus]|uniref:General secretion pathway protein D n=1 Tax=Roseateles saccharophilus TaxID=304 RepID=A0A4R3UYK8_ROSSA|nr:secretin N-terminal domain-containing protein [Roseateles saccharophilus]MDG0833073.1 general secretion pathway protein GspD [Roseateles saccharophilus]TCU96272.1 general secretion pathway protein D [Roseateles saccharophilus]